MQHVMLAQLADTFDRDHTFNNAKLARYIGFESKLGNECEAEVMLRGPHGSPHRAMYDGLGINLTGIAVAHGGPCDKARLNHEPRLDAKRCAGPKYQVGQFSGLDRTDMVIDPNPS